MQFETMCNGSIEIGEKELKPLCCGSNVSQLAGKVFDILEEECILVGTPGDA